MGVKDILRKDKELFSNGSSAKASASDCMDAMVHILSEGDVCDLREILSVLQAYFRGEVLSIVDIASRELIACTDEAYMPTAKKVAGSIRDLATKEYYLKHEKNGVFFPKECECVLNYPLKYGRTATYSLLVEQKVRYQPSVGRCLEVLAIALRLHLQEKTVALGRYLDGTTGLKNRDALLSFLEETEGTSLYVGMLVLKNLTELAVGYGYTWAEDSVKAVGALMGRLSDDKELTHIYRYSYDKICIVMNRADLHDAVAVMQDIMDDVEADIKGIDLGCVLTPFMAEPYRVLLTLEKVGERATSDAVTVFRDIEELEEEIQPKTSQFYLAQKFTAFLEQHDGKEEEETFSEMLEKIIRDAKRERTAKSKEVSADDMEEDFDLFYSIPEQEALNV